MDESPPVSVILPTIAWTAACEEVADQLGPEDELLVVCDSGDEPVTERAGDHPGNVRLLVAGEPERCSGKANAVAVGMEAARHDRLVWTDDDFHHPRDWLETLRTDYERHGPTSELPFFVGRDPLSLQLEPLYAVGGTLGVYARFGVRRWTSLLAYPSLLDQVPLAAYALARRTFVWGGRRYRWRSKFDVEVVDRDA